MRLSVVVSDAKLDDNRGRGNRNVSSARPRNVRPVGLTIMEIASQGNGNVVPEKFRNEE